MILPPSMYSSISPISALAHPFTSSPEAGLKTLYRDGTMHAILRIGRTTHRSVLWTMYRVGVGYRGDGFEPARWVEGDGRLRAVLEYPDSAGGGRGRARRSTRPESGASAPRHGCRTKWAPVRNAAPDRRDLPVHVRGFAQLHICARLQVRYCRVLAERPTLRAGGRDGRCSTVSVRPVSAPGAYLLAIGCAAGRGDALPLPRGEGARTRWSRCPRSSGRPRAVNPVEKAP